MAKETVNQQGDDQPDAALQTELRELAQDANFEVFQLANALRKILSECEVCWEGERAARGMLMRISNLSDIVYEAFLTDEDNQNTDLGELRRRLGVQALVVQS